ncbi:unnamed protein product [Pocillopora meandrina]|uniref:LAGLIDADG endonuclease n=1 Tax=Pocillopora meandrina TaxID=46732 RepID=A0AAU9XHV1_9CNID|nr:unnamed protein product [Pocillopora meandrina]
MSKLSQISRIRFVFDEQLLETIINALVFSKLYYCSSVWSSASVCDIRKLHYVQNLAARNRSATNLRWLPVKTQLYRRDAAFTFKCMTGQAPEYFTSMYITRGSAYLDTENVYYKSVSIWNKLDPSLKLCKSPASFRRALKSDLLNEFLN